MNYPLRYEEPYSPTDEEIDEELNRMINQDWIDFLDISDAFAISPDGLGTTLEKAYNENSIGEFWENLRESVNLYLRDQWKDKAIENLINKHNERVWNV